MAFLYLFKEGEAYSRQQFLMTYGAFIIMALTVRAATVLSLKLYRQAGYNYSRYAIVGKGDLAALIRGFYNERKELGYRFCGMFEFNNHNDELNSLEALMGNQKLDYVYCCLSEMSDEQVRGVIKLGERQKLRYV